MKHGCTREQGEGKVGCIVTLLVLAVVGGAAVKIVPEYMSNDSLMSLAKDLASRAGVRPADEIRVQILAKAKELELPEAMRKEAITINVTPSPNDKNMGTCTIRIQYTRNVDFYGITSYRLNFDKSVSMPYMDAR